MLKKTMVLGALMCTMACKKETTEWWICYGATGPDDPEHWYYEFRETEMCFENSNIYRSECREWGGSTEVVLETEDFVIESSILDPYVEEACANQGFDVSCPGELGYSKAWVQAEEDCPVYE